MEYIPALTEHQEEILEKIQVNSYNIDNKFKQLNEQLLADTTTSTAITIYQGITKINSSINIILAIIIFYVVLQTVKLRGEKR